MNIISHLAALSNSSSPRIDEKRRVQCLMTFPEAVWSLAHATLESSALDQCNDVKTLWFSRGIIDKCMTTGAGRPHCAVSALALVCLCRVRSLQRHLDASVCTSTRTYWRRGAQLQSTIELYRVKGEKFRRAWKLSQHDMVSFSQSTFRDISPVAGNRLLQ